MREPGHGPVHLLLDSAAEIGFAWDSGIPGWCRPFGVLSSMLGEIKVSGESKIRPLLNLKVSLHLLNSTHVWERDDTLLQARFRFCGGPDGHLFWDCTIPLMISIREYHNGEEKVARNQLESCMDAHSAHTTLAWDPAHGFDAEKTACSMPQHTNIWSDGSSVPESVSCVSSAGSGMYSHILGGQLGSLGPHQARYW